MEVYNKVQSGEIAGSATAKQLPDIPCRMAKLTAAKSNTGQVYIGGAGVTKADGSQDATTGLELAASDTTDWMPIRNLNLLHIICDNATDDLTYMALG